MSFVNSCVYCCHICFVPVSRLGFCKDLEALLLKQLDLNWLIRTNLESAALYYRFHLFWKLMCLLSKVVTVCGFAGNAVQCCAICKFCRLWSFFFFSSRLIQVEIVVSENNIGKVIENHNSFLHLNKSIFCNIAKPFLLWSYIFTQETFAQVDSSNNLLQHHSKEARTQRNALLLVLINYPNHLIKPRGPSTIKA